MVRIILFNKPKSQWKGLLIDENAIECILGEFYIPQINKKHTIKPDYTDIRKYKFLIESCYYNPKIYKIQSKRNVANTQTLDIWIFMNKNGKE